MNSTRLGPSVSLLAPACAATLGAGIDEPFGNLIPPFLLAACPYFFPAAVYAAKRDVDIVTASDERRSTVTVVRRKQVFVDRDESIGRRSKLNRFCRRIAFIGEFLPPSNDFSPPLFAAFHKRFKDGATPVIRPCTSGSRPQPFWSHRRDGKNTESCPDRS